MNKKILKLLIITLTLLIFNNKVSAKMLTIDEIVEEFPKTEIIKDFNKQEANIKLSLDKQNNKIKYIINEIEYGIYNYTDEYIEFDDRNTEITDETSIKNVTNYFGIAGLLSAVLNKAGYQNKFIKSEEGLEFENSYDKYGLQINSEKYELTLTDGSSSGDFIRYFKLSLNTDKIDKLMTDYGTNIDEININYLPPSLSTEEISDSYIKLNVKANTIEQNNLVCKIYKSTSKNGEYKELSQKVQNCEKGSIITDNDIKPGITYYYKAIIEADNNENYSDIVSVTIPKQNQTTPTPKESQENNDILKVNPKTQGLPIIIITCILSSISFVFSIYFFKKIHN